MNWGNKPQEDEALVDAKVSPPPLPVAACACMCVFGAFQLQQAVLGQHLHNLPGHYQLLQDQHFPKSSAPRC